MLRAYNKILIDGSDLCVTVVVPTGKDVRFSVTAEIRKRSRLIANGYIHKEVLQNYPELADVVALNLCDKHGVPLYAESNGWYWLTIMLGKIPFERYQPSQEECRANFIKFLRVSPEEIADIADATRVIFERDGDEKARANLKQWLASFAPRWQAEADAVIKKYR